MVRVGSSKLRNCTRAFRRGSLPASFTTIPLILHSSRFMTDKLLDPCAEVKQGRKRTANSRDGTFIAQPCPRVYDLGDIQENTGGSLEDKSREYSEERPRFRHGV